MNIRRIVNAFVPLFGLCWPACGAAPEDTVAETLADPIVQPLQAANPSKEVKLHADGLTVWLRREVKAQASDGPTAHRLWTLQGRVGGNIEAVRSFIIGDGFGRSDLTGPRSFAVTLDAHELNSLLSGLRLFIDVTPTSRRTSHATLGVSLVPMFREQKPHASIALAADIKPVNVAGLLVYRGRVTTAPTTSVFVRSSDRQPVLTHGGPEQWRVDLPFETLASEAASRGSMKFTRAEAPRAGFRAEVDLVVGEADLFRGDAEARYPDNHECAPSVQACIDALAGGDFDYGSCGAYRNVALCELPSSLPELSLIEHEEVDGILQAALEARESLPEARSLYVYVYSVQGFTDKPPRTQQVVRAWQQALGQNALVASPPAALEASEAFLRGWHAWAVFERARGLYDEAPAMTRLQSSEEGRGHILLHFPQAGRLVVLDLLST